MYKKMCIFDLDGTLNLTDRRLSVEILKLSKMGVDFIVSTGRSNSYVVSTFRKNRILPPRYIIADNGGSIYDTRKRKYLRKTLLSTQKRKAVISEFLRLGGSLEDIRFSDGNNLFVAEDEHVRKYYANDSAIYCRKKDIVDEVLREDTDVIKITLSGKKELIGKLQEYIKEQGIECFTDAGVTAFPERKRKNVRLDITDSQMSKGEGVKFLVENLGINKFLCVGNGMNDLSMFKYAIDTGNKVLIVKNFEGGKLQKESEELIRKTEEYAKAHGGSKDLVYVSYPVNGLVGSMEAREYSRELSKAFVKKVRKKPDTLPKLKTKVVLRQRTRRDRNGREH